MGCRSCGVARSIIAGFHPVDPGSNPGTSTISRNTRKAFVDYKLYDKRPNSYSLEVTRLTMTIIQCPHCDGDVELPDGAVGLFDCPHCNNEFEYGSETPSNIIKLSYKPSIGIIITLVISIIFAVGAGIMYLDSTNTIEFLDNDEQDDPWAGFLDGWCAFILMIIAGVFLVSASITYFSQVLAKKYT